MTSEGLTQLTSRQLSHALSEESSPGTAADPSEQPIEWTNRISLLILDIDRFAEVTASMGPQGGEEVLAVLAGRLRAVLRPNQVLMRLEGDEFAVVLPDAGREVAERVCQDLLGQLDNPLSITWAGNTRNVDITISVGSATCLPPRQDPRHLVRQAGAALTVAKEEGGGGISHFDPDRAVPVRTRPRSELRIALEQQEVEIYLQPKVWLSDNAVCGAEALARWRHPRDGVLLPDTFLPLAARTGLLKPIATAVLGRAVRECATWWHAGHHVPVSVNLTPTDLLDPSLTDLIPDCLRPLGLPPQALQVEVTEEVFLADTAPVAALLERWASQGIAVALDDFGTGYSSLAYLRALPIAQLKLDKVFVADLARSTTTTIVRHTIAMAHELGMQVVAEGIEDAQSAARLRELGCDVGQGLYFGKAMPPKDFRDYLDANPTSPTRPST